jgi:DNA-binding LacI/PurR family transcriptional regulator
VAERVVQEGRGGIFCCNDRLAEAVLEWCAGHHRPVPPLVGFDDAPIAEQLGLTTIAIPWREMTAAAIAVIRRRLVETPATASRQVFAPRPVVRRLIGPVSPGSWGDLPRR